MASCRVLLLLVPGLLQQLCVHAYPSGPPSSACLNQQPFHLVSPTQYALYPGYGGASPRFAINVSSASWTAGSSLTVTLVRVDPTIQGFAGFVIKASRASGGFTNGNLGPLLGSFACTTSAGSTVPAKHMSVYAPGGENNCVSHSQADDNLYQNVTCLWTAPATNEGPIVFSATVVVVYEDYQTQIVSSVLPNVAGPPSFALPNDTMTNPPSMSGCGTTKTCALYPSLCDSRVGGCRAGVMMTKQAATGDLLFEMFGTTFDWIAVAFGDNPVMENLEVVTCGYDPRQGKVLLEFGFIPQKYSPVVPLYRSDVSMVKTMYSAGSGSAMSLPVQPNTIYCQFVRPVDSAFSYYSYNMSTSSSVPVNVASKLSADGKFVMLAQGQNIPNTRNLGKHTHLPLRSPRKFSAGVDPTKMYFAGLDAKVQTHATLMTIFWFLFCGFGVIVARHARPVMTQKLMKKQLWFLMHVGTMVLGYIVAIAGVIYILVKNGEWETDTQIHGILGLIGMGLGLLNIIAGVFRPHPGANMRPIFNRLHRYNGMLAFIVSGIAIWLGATFNDHRPEFRFWIIIVLGIWTCLQVIFMIGFEAARRVVMRNKSLEQSIVHGYQMTDVAADASTVHPAANGDTPEPTKDAKSDKPVVHGKQLLHVTDAWIAVYACTFVALAAAFWAGLWIH